MILRGFRSEASSGATIGHSALLLGKLAKRSDGRGIVSGVLRLLVARAPTFILLTAALSVAGAPAPARAAEKTAIEIVPGAKTISPEERTMKIGRASCRERV